LPTAKPSSRFFVIRNGTFRRSSTPSRDDQRRCWRPLLLDQ
jgi:hypothetical protein